mgnify:CR=1 FL=1
MKNLRKISSINFKNQNDETLIYQHTHIYFCPPLNVKWLNFNYFMHIYYTHMIYIILLLYDDDGGDWLIDNERKVRYREYRRIVLASTYA